VGAIVSAPGSTRLQQDAARRTRSIVRSVGESLRASRQDAGLSQRQVAIAAGLSQPHLSALEAGTLEPSLGALVALSLALGGEVSLRFFPGTGPILRDRTQASMVEALLRIVGPRWSCFPEVPVHQPASGVIDLVLADLVAGILVAAEFHSDLRRLEQQVRWARAKAESLGSTSIGALSTSPGAACPRVERLLVLRSTIAMRELAVAFEKTLAAVYPARAAAILDSIAGAAPWPGAGILWVRVDGRRTHVMDAPPPGVALGR
jgi:transcriptional regulator with XRE-family HTH domain